jgi:hypothetical protein
MARIPSISVLATGLGLFVYTGCAASAGANGRMSSCTNAGGRIRGSTPATVAATAPNPPRCADADTTEFFGPTTVSDFPDGVSSDGRGPYVQGGGAVVGSVVGNEAALSIDGRDKTTQNPRRLTVNLNRPVPGGGGVPLGITTDGGGLITQQFLVGNVFQNLKNIPVGQTVKAGQMNVSASINGNLYILQMGPQAHGHCMTNTNRVTGVGTSSGTIYRASETKWVMDLPAGSVGRLFDFSNLFELEPDHRDWQHAWDHAVDKGLYYVHLHYEIGK